MNFWNDTFLAFALIVDENLEQVRYSYHYRRRGGALIFRKDNVHSHRGHPHLAHIHREPGRPHAAEPFDEVDLEEALAEVGKFITGTCRRCMPRVLLIGSADLPETLAS